MRMALSDLRWPCLFGFALLAAVFPSALVAENLGFGGPEVLKLDWSTRAMIAADLNQDELTDLAVINNDTMRIDMFYQLSAAEIPKERKKQVSRNRWDPILEDARFDRDGITVGFPMFELAVGDLNGDGLADLVYTAREVPLTVRLQAGLGTWPEPIEISDFDALGWAQTLSIKDLDHDGRAELVVVGNDAIRVFRTHASGRMLEPKLYYLTGSNPFNLMLEDVTDDGRVDMLYITSAGKQSLVLREQLENGEFGPERRFALSSPVTGVKVLPSGEGKGGRFCAIDSRSGALEFFHLKRKAGMDGLAGLMDVQPEVYPLYQQGRDAALYAIADLDGDGREDLLVGSSGSAEIVLFRGESNGFSSPEHYPSFSKISAVATGHFVAQATSQLIAVSAAEKMLGISQLDSAGRLSFPKSIKIGEMSPLACEAIDINSDGWHELALVTERPGKKYFLSVIVPMERTHADTVWRVLSEIELKGLRRAPEAVQVLDVFGAGSAASGLLVYVPREAPVLLAVNEAGDGFQEIAKNSPLRESMLKGTSRAKVTAFDVDGDGDKELIVGRQGYVRAMRIEGGDLDMVDQFNARRSDDQVSAVLPHLENGQLKGMYFYVSSEGQFQYLKRDQDGVYRYDSCADVGPLNLVNSIHEASEGGILLPGSDQFWRLPAFGNSWEVVVDSVYETELDSVHYTNLQGVDFDGDGTVELVAVDGRGHFVELIDEYQGQWKNLMYWEIFERNLHYQGRTGSQVEPRQVLIADLNGDGRMDFSFLIHDRILFYPQL